MIDSVSEPLLRAEPITRAPNPLYALNRLGYDTGCDLKKLTLAAEEAKAVRAVYGEFEGPYSGVDCKMLVTQIPGGVMSNFSSQLRIQNALPRLNEIVG